ncbi:holo-ACP synthase [Anaeroselena agilis]|uniref:Holo-[acyl-carrier-protein] synthase n=1 Tax=Anaeroselena agilis TaxID=3063788 RepID=A0ABU3NT66_9FIRM|nr:holo-ACP synthase [Selenomonadales bacterium 4137-cl]
MIVGIGIDIIDIDRVGLAVERGGFARRVFTAAEREYCDGRGVQRPASYAARFAGKEAVMKAFGTGLSAGTWQDIEILSGPNGRPEVKLHGNFAHLAEQLGVTAVHVSLSHARDYAAAQAVLWGGGER